MKDIKNKIYETGEAIFDLFEVPSSDKKEYFTSQGEASARLGADLIIMPLELIVGLPSFATGLYFLNNVESVVGYIASGALTLAGGVFLGDYFRRSGD